jgi:hypothetical protein
MEKEFVLYEQSLELKKLGFDEPCFAYFKDEEFQYPNPYEPFKNSEMKSWCITAPLYQQAFRWFREKYNIIPNIHSIYTDETHTKIMFWFWFGNYEDDSDEEVFYGTYEETELECITALINIVERL